MNYEMFLIFLSFSNFRILSSIWGLLRISAKFSPFRSSKEIKKYLFKKAVLFHGKGAIKKGLPIP